MNNEDNFFGYLKGSKFMRSMLLRVLSVFLIVGIAIVAIVFYSFSSEINKNIISKRQNQLFIIEDAVSTRMDEATSIAYNIGSDSSFFLEPVESPGNSGYEISKTLKRYLVGNGFIEYLAYYRRSEPEKIYFSKGELSFRDFWSTYLGVDEKEAEGYINGILSLRAPAVVSISIKDYGAYFAYTYPLPQFSEKPQAFVLMLIPISEIAPLSEDRLYDFPGKITIYDSAGTELYSTGTLPQDVPVDLDEMKAAEKAIYKTVNGERYVLQSEVSDSNGWTYVSAVRLRDIVSGLADKQLSFILLLLGLMFFAVFILFIGIINQYKPISELAKNISGDKETGDIIDEGTLLSDTFATLKDDSEQKQKFEDAYHEAQYASKAKSAFFSSMSHDIRTPLNAITGMTAIAYKHANEPDYVRECLDKVLVASQYLLDIINNVLDMSRIESGKFALTQDVIEIPKFVYGIMTILNQSMESKKLRLVVETENIQNEKIFGDNLRLMQIFMNILSNSVKFTPEGGTICLKIKQESSGENSGFVFTFSDTGIGMAPEFVEHVFDTFSRAETGSVSRIEGTGLGMAIVKNLVELMDGKISCESELGKGTKFTVTMSFKTAAEEKMSTGKYKNISVLILSTEESLCKNQKWVFENAGASAEYALSVSEAAKKAAAKEFSYILLNPSDSDKNGTKAAKRLSSAKGAPKLVFASASPEKIKQADAKKSGIGVFIPAPLFISTARSLFDGEFDCAPQAEKTENRDFSGIRVLLVEDNSINREIARRILTESGAEVFEAVDGKAAFEMFQKSHTNFYDIILMDLQMPVMNGYESTAAIRSLLRIDAKSVPIYAMTANTFDEDVRQVREAGMDGHLGKPYTPEDLYKLLSKIKK